MQQSFGEFLSSKRKEKGLTQKQIADTLFVTESAVSKWEIDKAHPDISLLPKLAELLGVTEHELITSCVDEKQRVINKDAKKWKNLNSTWNMFFYIAYGITLLTCFIVNLATSGTLSWFWIVFSALLFSASFTTIPQFITKLRLLFITLTQLFTLLFMLAVICIQCKGNWFGITTMSILFVFVMVFLPIYVHTYKMPSLIKKNNAVFCCIVDYILCLLMLLSINGFVKGQWFWSFALPIASVCFVVAMIVTVFLAYLKTNKFLKTGIVLGFFEVFLLFFTYSFSTFISNFLKAEKQDFSINLTDWANCITGNVFLIMFIVLGILAFTFAILGIFKHISNQEIKDKR